jgi:DNA gyrase subunit A
MAKRKKGDGGEPMEAGRPENIELVSLADTARERYLNYALSVITSRALPDVRDGLKPVQRRILYAMWNDARATADSRYVKSAAVVGDVMGKYHPHGDASLYEALVRMAQPFTLRYPLVDGYGNFGSIDGDPPASMRYTECRLMRIADAILEEIRQGTVDFRPNYAATVDEPVVLPAQVPLLLVNGASGIAVGMATNIPPHNLGEVCKALLALLDNDRDLPVEKLIKYIQGPDFPTGGVISCTADEIRQVYATGQGTLKVRGTYEPDPEDKDRIWITSIPYGIEKDALVQRIGDLISKGQVPQLVNVKDLSAEDIRIVLELRPGANADAAMAYLFKNTPLQSNFSVNLTCLQPAAEAEIAVPKRLDLRSILLHFLDFRMEVLTRRLRHELEALRRRIHILEGFAIVFNNLDEAIRIIRDSNGKADAAPKLIARFGLSDEQADAILETKLYRLGKLEIQDILDELAARRARADEIEALLADEPGRWGLIRDEIKAIQKQYGDPRRTRIEGPAPAIEFKVEDYIVDEDAWVIVTRDGWIKRQKSFTDIASIRVRDEDRVGWVYRARARQTLTFFTDRGMAYSLRVNDIVLTTGHGEPIQRQFSFEDGEHIVDVICHDPRCLPRPAKVTKKAPKNVQTLLPGVSTNGDAPHAEANGDGGEPEGPFGIAFTAGGKVLRFSLATHATVSNKKGRAVMRLDAAFPGDKVIAARPTTGEETVSVVTKLARLLVFPIGEVNVVSGVAKGVTAIRLGPKDEVLGVALTVGESERFRVRTGRGAEQVVRPSKYPLTSRGGKGYAILQRGALDGIIEEEVQPVPPQDQVDQGA